MITQLTGLVVDPNPNGREFLWQVAYAEATFRRVKGVAKLETALRQLTVGRSYDVVFIASSFTETAISTFIAQAKATEGGQESAYICVLKRRDQSTDNVAFGLIDGTDGFLLEPYSVNAVRQVAEIALRIKKEFERKRKKAAITLIVRKLINTLDTYALAQFLDKDVRLAKQSFANEVKALKRFTAEDLEIYREVVFELFEHAPPRPPIAYHGASERVKKKLTRERARDRLKDIGS